MNGRIDLHRWAMNGTFVLSAIVGIVVLTPQETVAVMAAEILATLVLWVAIGLALGLAWGMLFRASDQKTPKQ